MKLTKKILLATVLLAGWIGGGAQAQTRWSEEKANAWYQNHRWLVGCNFSPSTAINQLEMWQADSFDPKTIDRELVCAGKLNNDRAVSWGRYDTATIA